MKSENYKTQYGYAEMELTATSDATRESLEVYLTAEVPDGSTLKVLTCATVPPSHRPTVPPHHRSTAPPSHRTTAPPHQVIGMIVDKNDFDDIDDAEAEDFCLAKLEEDVCFSEDNAMLVSRSITSYTVARARTRTRTHTQRNKI